MNTYRVYFKDGNQKLYTAPHMMALVQRIADDCGVPYKVEDIDKIEEVACEKRKMNIEERQKLVLAMEYIVRQVNDEDVFMPWLSIGVGDGDIHYGKFDKDEVDDYYIDDDNFRDLMSLFLRIMVRAFNSGGLYCDGIVSKDRSDYEQDI